MIAASVWYRRLFPLSCRAGLAVCVFVGSASAGGMLRAQAVAPASVAAGQGESWLAPVPYFPLASDESTGSLTIRQHAEALKPFTVAGKCGAFVGQQDGSFEAWARPIKLLSHFRMVAELENYTVPIDVNDQAAEIEVAPDHTTITFAHAAFTIREIFFATPCKTNGAGGMVLFQIDSIRPMKLTFSMTPEIKQMWPAPNYNAPSPEWVSTTSKPVEGAQAGSGGSPGVGGYYLLHTDSDALAGAIAMPGTEPGILAPYQERPKTWPLQLILHYEPARDGAKYFPLLMAGSNTAGTASKAALSSQLVALGAHVPELYRATAEYYTHFFDERLTAETPDKQLDQALRWAEISIDQLRVQHGDELGLVAGLYNSGDSNRPGFGWFFGRDALFTLFAVNSYGDFALTRQELLFLLRRQRDDGKIMHEYSQTAELVDWKSLPYEYAAADATPLFLMAVDDYVQASGDLAWLREHWPAVEKAYTFERTHDTDGDGIYDNAQGTGWVESWPVGMPHQEIYLAALDQQATAAYARMARLSGQSDAGAESRAGTIAGKIEREYAQPGAGAAGQGARGGMYAFSRGKDGTLDTTATIYPAIAWFDGHYRLTAADGMFQRWASHEFSTDWGTRDLGEDERFYDPISYHQGSVWPLFTGWAAIAEYRTGRSLSGYAHLMQNAQMTWAQDLGAVTELLSGQYYEPFGRSTTHQLWSSAMVVEPELRGLFGLSVDAPAELLRVQPELPAEWDGATLKHVRVGGSMVTLVFAREGSSMTVRAQAEGGSRLPRLAGAGALEEKGGVLRLPLPGAELGLPAELPLPGARTTQLKVLEQHAEAHAATWVLEAQGGSTYRLPVRLNGVKGVQAEGGTMMPAGTCDPGQVAAACQTTRLPAIEVRFPPGAGYMQQAVTVRW